MTIKLKSVQSAVGAAALVLAVGACGSSHDPATTSATSSAKAHKVGDVPAMTVVTATQPPPDTTVYKPVDQFPVKDGTASSDGTILVVADDLWTTYDVRSGTDLYDNTDPDYYAPCGAAVVERADGVHVVLSVDQDQTEAEGVNDATESFSLVAANAETGDPLWTTELHSAGDDDDPCAAHGSDSGYADLSQVVAGSPGKQSVLVPSQNLGNFLVNLTDGSVKSLGAGNAKMVGSSVVLAADGSSSADLFDADTGAAKGSAHGALAACANRVDYGGCPVFETAQGTVFVTSTRHGSDDGSLLAATGPTGQTVLWTTPGDAEETELVAAGPVLAEPGVAYPADSVSAVDVLTGDPAWQYREDISYCGYTTNKVFLIANDQLAILDAKTGKQLDFDPDISECPTVVDGAIIENAADGLIAIPEL